MINGHNFVFSPHWPDSDKISNGKLPAYVNPNYPFGCLPDASRYLFKRTEVVLIPPKKHIVVKRLKVEKKLELKRLKAEVVNKKKLTTIVRTSLDPKLRVGV
jgi:hypothetical protein